MKLRLNQSMDDKMKNAVAVVLLLAAASFAQDKAPLAKPRAACGSSSVQFEVKTDKTEKKRPLAEPPADRALVYVIQNLRAGCFMCDTTTRIGLDGAWVGATRGNSYFSFSLEPGEHHLCADLQFVAAGSETTALASLNADSGTTYFFRARLTDQNNTARGAVDWTVDLEQIDPDEGMFLIASYDFSNHHQKK